MDDISNSHLQWPWVTPNGVRSWHFWSRISQKQCILRTKLLSDTNRKPYPIYRIAPLLLTYDLDFNVTTFLKLNIWKTARLRDKVTIAHYRKPYHVWWPWLSSKHISWASYFNREKIMKIGLYLPKLL